MSQNGAERPGAYHIPVMVSEVVEIFRPVAAGVVVDATFGGGGHSRALAEALEQVDILAIDRDEDALAEAEPREVHTVHGNFADLAAIVDGLRSPGQWLDDGRPIVGVLFDLGVSSHQLDTAARGFSYHRRGPLDMRMDAAAGDTAATVVNEWPVAELERILRRYGEERFARRIARAIDAARPVEDTEELAAVIAAAVPAPARRRRHPARRTFQAIRIAVNGEIDALARGLDAGLDLVATGGRVAVITYHSLEDRVVKHRFAEGTAGCECPPRLPVCVCGKVSELRSLTRRGLTPSPEEVAANPRSRSARLRAVEKVAS